MFSRHSQKCLNAAISFLCIFFFFNDTATTEIYTLSLHDALPVSFGHGVAAFCSGMRSTSARATTRSEEHTSELQSRVDLVCRLLLEKKKINKAAIVYPTPGARQRNTHKPASAL